MGVYDDQRNDCTFAGPGAKRRQKIRTPKDNVRRTIKRPVLTPEPREEKAAHFEDTPKFTVKALTGRIIRHTLEQASVTEISDLLVREGYRSPSKIAVSNIRTITRDVIRQLLYLRLITEDDLERYRRRRAKREKQRAENC